MRRQEASKGKNMKVYVKIHSTGQRYGHRFIIAVCDKDLIGKTVKDKKITLKISERFYKGTLRTDEEVVEILREAVNANIMGKESIRLALKAGIIKKENIIKIKGVPHAQAVAF